MQKPPLTLYNFEDLLKAYRRVRLGKREKNSTVLYDTYLERNLHNLSYILKSHTYKPFPYTYFVITDPKRRHIAAPHFQDRIVHRALINIIEPELDKQFIYDSFACRKGKGTHFGLRRVKKFLMAARTKYGKNTPLYILKCDIEKYFASVSWDILLSILRKKVSDPYLLTLFETIITNHKVYKVRGTLQVLPEEVVRVEARRGMPIGNLTSQLFANLYLNELDQYVKHTLKVRWYGRYMDDFLIISPDKQHLKEVRNSIRIFLRDHLSLSLHPKKVSIQNVDHGVCFVGYRIFYDHVLVKGKTLRRFHRRFKKRMKKALTSKTENEKSQFMEESFLGHLKFACTWNLRKTLIKPTYAKVTTANLVKELMTKYNLEKALFVQKRLAITIAIAIPDYFDPLHFLDFKSELMYSSQKFVYLYSTTDLPDNVKTILITEGVTINMSDEQQSLFNDFFL